MARALAMTRVRVAEEQQAGWLSALAELERLERAEGRHLWVFRHPHERDLFLEFSECSDAVRHRASSPAVGSAPIEQRLRQLATYESEVPVLWREVPLTVVPARGS
jgi:hypothetical protein